MSNTEIKASIDKMSDEERFFAAAYLQHLSEQRDPAYQTLLAQRMNRMDAGRKMTLEQAKRIHNSLESEGV
jgi:hypothetical protein